MYIASMKIHVTQPLFAWAELEDSPALRTLEELLALVPDQELLRALSAARGKGRDDYPVRVLWGTLLAQILLRHHNMESCLGELGRNPALRRALGIAGQAGVPKAHNMSRFLARLGEEPFLTLLRRTFSGLVGILSAAVPELGERTAGDATGLSARRGTNQAEQKAAREQGLAEAEGGRKECRNAAGEVEEVLEWFGYKLHLLVDVKHEVVVAYRITSAKEGDNQSLPELVRQAQGCLPAGRIKSLAYDRAADDEGVHEFLHAQGIQPIIETRNLWQEEHERMLPGHTGRSNIVYDEAGTVYCYDKVSAQPVRHRMAYLGHEPARGTLKYRCPAAHEGWRCPSAGRCNAGRKYGLTVRVKQAVDLRRFPPVPRATKQFERLYRGRSAVERVNARLKVFWGADDGNVAGARRFHAQVGALLVAHAAVATLLARAPRWEGKLSYTRLGPIQKALQATRGP